MESSLRVQTSILPIWSPHWAESGHGSKGKHMVNLSYSSSHLCCCFQSLRLELSTCMESKAAITSGGFGIFASFLLSFFLTSQPPLYTGASAFTLMLCFSGRQDLLLVIQLTPSKYKCHSWSFLTASCLRSLKEVLLHLLHVLSLHPAHPGAFCLFYLQ